MIIIITVIIIMIIIIIIIMIIITKDGCHYVWRAQTALIRYARGPAEWLTLKLDTGMLTHLPLRDSGTRLQDTLCPGHRCFEDSLLVSWAWVSQRRPWALLFTERRTRATLDLPRCQVHITSIADHQHTCKVQETALASQHGPSHTVQTIVNRRTQHGLSPQHRPFTTVE